MSTIVARTVQILVRPALSMNLRRPTLVLVLAAVLAAVPAGRAGAQTPPEALPKISARASVVERGWIRLKVAGTPGAVVTVRETTGDLDELVATLRMPAPSTGRKRLATWRCDPLTREYTVTATLADGRATTTVTAVSTPACKRRFSLGRASGRAGRGLDVAVRDRFGVGGERAEVCAAPAGRTLRCRVADFADGRATRVVRVPASRPGRYRIVLRTRFGQRVRSTGVVRRVGGRFRLLAAGDSMIQIIDGFLAQRTRKQGVRVRSDDHVATGITKPAQFDWLRRARETARTFKPDVTVMFLGANDGFPIPRRAGGRVECCGGEWTSLYADRVATMMRSYLRGGAGRVYWMLLPAARGDEFDRYFRATNRGIAKAAARFDRSQVRVIDLRGRFTPGGRYRQTIRHAGRSVSVRAPDGVHLNTKGASIAADIILRALRADGYLRAR